MPVSAVIVPSIHNHLTRAETENSTLGILSFQNSRIRLKQ